MIPSQHHEQMAPHGRFSGAFCNDPSNRMETRLFDFRILANSHPLVRVHFGNEFDGGEGVEEARGGVRGGQGSRGSGKVSGVGGGGGRMG